MLLTHQVEILSAPKADRRKKQEKFLKLFLVSSGLCFLPP